MGVFLKLHPLQNCCEAHEERGRSEIMHGTYLRKYINNNNCPTSTNSFKLILCLLFHY